MLQYAFSMLKSLDCEIKLIAFRLKLTLEYVKLPEYRAIAWIFRSDTPDQSKNSQSTVSE